MKSSQINNAYSSITQQRSMASENKLHFRIIPEILELKPYSNIQDDITEVLFITSYPPRVCAIATYSHDLIYALNNKFSNSLSIKVCALESGSAGYQYPGEVKYVLNTSVDAEYEGLALAINNDKNIKIVLIQHEFGFFKAQEKTFLKFIYDLSKPVVIVFHTILPRPDKVLRSNIRSIASACKSIIVMTDNSLGILTHDYGLPMQQITVIPYGTHLVPHISKRILKAKYRLKGRRVLTTFGLLSSGKSIETTLESLPVIIKQSPEVFSTVWENSSVAHAMLFEKTGIGEIIIRYNLPVINLNHVKKLTTDIGIIQISKIYHPDINPGYTLDDNARALVAMCMYYRLTADKKSLQYIQQYLDFIKRCMISGGVFLNYTDKDNNFTAQNKTDNLDDANGRAIWALGYAISLMGILPYEMVSKAINVLDKSLRRVGQVHSTRAMAFAIKGIYHYYSVIKSPKSYDILVAFANRLVQMYKHESDNNWKWFEGYLTYTANSILPESLLYSWLVTGDTVYKDIAVSSLNFLLSQTFTEKGIEVISNRKWLLRGNDIEHYGEQPIDVAYTIMTLSTFHDALGDEDYRMKMITAFNWFLGNNRLHQIVYNPCTGGCYDGLEETHVNLNQGAESTISYLMARLTVEKHNEYYTST